MGRDKEIMGGIGFPIALFASYIKIGSAYNTGSVNVGGAFRQGGGGRQVLRSPALGQLITGRPPLSSRHRFQLFLQFVLCQK